MMNDEAISSWVGGIYQKLEALCLGADDMMRQEARDLIENHLPNVGANVKQFYSELVRDVLSPKSSSPDEPKNVPQPDPVARETTNSASFEVVDEKSQLQIQTDDLLLAEEEKDVADKSASCYSPFVEVTQTDSTSLERLDNTQIIDEESVKLEYLSPMPQNTDSLEGGCILEDDNDVEYVIARILSCTSKRHWCQKHKNNWKFVRHLVVKSLKQKQVNNPSPSVASFEVIEHEEKVASTPSMAEEEDFESEWELV